MHTQRCSAATTPTQHSMPTQSAYRIPHAGGTRTCIHTPGAPLDPAELTPRLLDAALQDAQLVYFDGRATEAALVVADAARRRGIPILVECERLRPCLDTLAAHADYVTTSAHFPQVWRCAAHAGRAHACGFGAAMGLHVFVVVSKSCCHVQCGKMRQLDG